MKIKLLLVGCVLGLVAGCKIAIIVPSGGGVVSSNAAHNCAEGNVCEFEINTGQLPFSETLTAIPKAGYEFEKWSDGSGFLCGKSTNPTCTVNVGDGAVGAIIVALFQSGYVMPIFKDVGIDTDDDGVRNELDADDDGDGIPDDEDACPLEPNLNCLVNEVSGIFYEDLYWRKEDGPYVLVGEVYVNEFFTLNIEAGTDVRSQSGKILIRGNLDITGTPEAPVTLNNTYIDVGGSQNYTNVINIDYAEFDHSEFNPLFGECIYTNASMDRLTITNSKFSNCSVELFSPLGGGSPAGLIEKNTFDHTASIFSGPLSVQKNLFLPGNPEYGSPVRLRKSEGSNPLFNYNTILHHPASGGGQAVVNERFSPDTDGTNNYWGTTDYRVIDLVILDQNDTTDIYYGYLNYLPLLDAPHPDTPTSP